jgi:hypothetical protein
MEAKAISEALMRGDIYLVLARLAEVNERILRDAGDEQLFEKLGALEQATTCLLASVTERR